MTRKGIILYAVRALVGIVFIISAVLKFIGIDAFELYIYGFDILNLDLSYLFARMLILGEFALGLWLLSNQNKSVCNKLTYAILAAFSIFLIIQIIRGEEGNCHCMGEDINISPLNSLLKNILLFALTWVSSKAANYDNKYIKLTIFLLFICTGVAMFMVSPPDTWAEEKLQLCHNDELEKFLQTDNIYNTQTDRKKKTIVCLLSTSCKICKLSARKLQIILDKTKGVQVYEIFDGTEEEVNNFWKESQSNQQAHKTLPSDSFWLMTGSVPVFAIVEDGKVTEAFSYRTMNEKKIESAKNN